MPRKKKSTPQSAESLKKRKNFLFPRDLALWAESYAEKKNSNLTQIIVVHLTELREEDMG